MGALDSFFQGQNGTTTGSTTAQTSNLPDWYNQYIQGIGGKAIQTAQNAESQPIPQQSVAGFTPDQTQAFQQVRQNQGVWQPYLGDAQERFGNSTSSATTAQNQANGAVAGPAANFTQNWQQYMSPYTSSVVNEIARLGNQNFQEGIMPQIQASMIGSGQFGSERNADVLGRAARDAQQNITGQQASALEAGYSTAGNLFNQDANRQQQQQATQASTALAGGQLATNAWDTSGQRVGALGQAASQMGLSDAQALQASGQQQQQLNQVGLDTAYNNQVGANNWDWNNLNNMSSLVRGAQLPTTQTGTTSGALTRSYSASPLSQLTSGVTGLFGQ